MPRTPPLVPLHVRTVLHRIGSDLRDARRRRRLPMAVVAERAQISLPTLQRVERGDGGVGFGTYATVLWVLGLTEKLNGLAAVETDTIGLGLERERLPQRVRIRRAPTRLKKDQ